MIVSRIIRLRLVYGRHESKAPASLILKTGLPERDSHGWDGVRNEIAFYNQVAHGNPTLPIPRCFEAHWKEETKTWYLLLEDLTDSHFVIAPWPLPPTVEQCEKIVEARARFHAAWWADPRIGTTIGRWRDDAARQVLLQDLGQKIALLADRLGDRLSPNWRSLYDQLLDAAPRLIAKHCVRQKATIVQGDAHPWNVFFPNDGSDDVRLFDWDAWRLDLGVSGIAHMMAVHWYPELRGRIERQLLDRYHEALLLNGVRDYDRRELDADYRFSTLWQITCPVWQAAYGIPPVIWWNNMERAMLAVDDVGCRDLLVRH